MSFSGEGSVRFDDDRMFSQKVHPIGESSNNNPIHLHGGSNVASGQVSDVRVANAIVGGVTVPPDAGVAAPMGGITTGIRPHPYFGARLTLMEDEAKSLG